MCKKKFSEAMGDTLPKRIDECLFYGFELDMEQERFANAILNSEIDIIFCNARAGTGKTTIAVGVANLLVKYGEYDEIIYIMSPYGERKQGWLPGTISEKSSVYFEPVYQALLSCNVNLNTAIKSDDFLNQKNGLSYVTCITDTFLRGVNLDNAVVIIDEAQNYTIQQLKTILTRIGKHSKVIVIGHELQCDLENVSLSGFTKYINHFSNMKRAAICNLTNNYRGWISRHADELGA